jgi:hypothetical protein
MIEISLGQRRCGHHRRDFWPISGRFLWAEAIPESWLERLAMREFITEMADSLALAEIAPGASIYDQN